MKQDARSRFVVFVGRAMVKALVHFLAVLGIAMLPLTAQAADRYWDGANTGGTGDGASDGGTATWDTSAQNWDQGNTLSRVAWVNGNNDTAILGGTAGTVSLGTGITVGGLQFDTAAYILQSNTLTFGTAGSLVANQNATISSVLAGSVAITKSGAGTLTLYGTNTYAGATIISDGTLQAGSAGAFNNTSSLLMTNGSGALDLNGNNVRFTATIIDNASESGTSTAALGTVGASFETSSLLIKDGPTRKVAVTLRNNNGGARFSNSGNTFSGGLILLDSPSVGWGTRLLPSTIVAGAYGSGPIIIGQAATDKAGIFFQVNNLPFTNDIVFNTALGTDLKGIRFDSSGHVLSGTINANLAPITFSSFNDGGATLSGKLTGPNGLSLESDTGVTTITLNNSATNSDYQGSTAINGKGVLVLGASNQIPNGASAGHVTNNGTFRLNGYSDTINGLSGTGIVDGISGTPTLTVGDNNATSTFSGVIRNTAGALALTKMGDGTLTLSGINTYVGATTVDAGKLVGVTGGSCSSSAVTVASGAMLGARVVTSGGQWSCGTLTLDSGTTAAEFDFSVIPSLTVAPMLINGDLVNNGTLNVRVVSGNFGVGSTYPLIQYTGILTIGALTTNLPAGVEGTLVNNTANKTIDLNVTVGNSLVWSAGTGLWDINTSSNWNNQTTTYTDGSSPLFDDSPAAPGPFTVTLSSHVLPVVVTVSNELKEYTITGSGSIAGAAELIKSGAGVLTLAITNTYTGATTVRAGTLKAGHTTAIPTNTTLSVINTGVFDLNGFNATVASVDAGGSSAVITNSAAGSGTNTLTFTTFPSINFAPRMVDGSGQKIAVVVGGNQAVPSLGNANNTFSGGLTISSSSGQTRLWQGSITTTTNADGSIRSSNLGAGPVIIGTTTGGAQLGNLWANAQIRNPIVFNAGTYIDGGNAALRVDAFGVELYGQLTANLSPVNMSSGGSGGVNVLGQITGPEGLWLKTPATALTLTLSNITASANNYQGTTRIDPKTTLALGKNEQIPHGVGTGNVTNNGTLRLNGFSETINGLSGTGIVDGVSGTPILTLGDNNATGPFFGEIKNTAGTLTLTKVGNGTQTLSGINTYNGTTTVSAGTLALVAPGSIGNSPLISVALGAIFDAGPGFTLGAVQTLAGEGAVLSSFIADGVVSPGIAGIGTLIASNDLTWNAGPSWPFELGAASASDRLTINGNLVQGSGADGEFVIDLLSTGVAGVYTLMTWSASTTFNEDGSALAVTNVPGGLTPTLTVGANALTLTLSGDSGFSAGSTNASIALVSGQVTFGFNIASGALYHVQASTNLLGLIDNGFTNITDQLTNNGTATILYTNDSPERARMFRINSP
jgi:autotransporter-associated beta strand protein